MKRACPKCGRVQPCPQHPHRPGGGTQRGQWRSAGSTYAWRKLRAQVLDRDGHRCRALDQRSMTRCTQTTNLEVHHLDPEAPLIVDSARLVTLCRAHHHAVPTRGRTNTGTIA